MLKLKKAFLVATLCCTVLCMAGCGGNTKEDQTKDTTRETTTNERTTESNTTKENGTRDTGIIDELGDDMERGVRDIMR